MGERPISSCIVLVYVCLPLSSNFWSLICKQQAFFCTIMSFLFPVATGVDFLNDSVSDHVHFPMHQGWSLKLIKVFFRDYIGFFHSLIFLATAFLIMYTLICTSVISGSIILLFHFPGSNGCSFPNDCIPDHVHLPLHLGDLWGLLQSFHCSVCKRRWRRQDYFWRLQGGLLLAETQHSWG